MKSSVDTKPPQQFSHIGGNTSKKLTADKGAARARVAARARSGRKPLLSALTCPRRVARQAEIDQGNARLLNTLTAIAAGGGAVDSGRGKEKPLSRGEAPRHAGPSMQATGQKMENERIALENERMLKRITQVRPPVAQLHVPS